MKRFGLLSEIDVDNPSSYEKVFLTFDVDWASDFVLEYSISLVEKANVKVTWFVTHDTPLLERLRKNPMFELGIHPNFNALFDGDFSYGKNYCEVLEYFLKIVPEAKVMRSHCLAVSSRMLGYAKSLGITHDSNICVPIMAKGAKVLMPFINWDGLIRCPYHFADDVACMYGEKISLKEKFEKYQHLIFGFHPIHIFLNTASLEQYEGARPYFNDSILLQSFRNGGQGAESILKEVLNWDKL